jgi:NDMA-dependent alcohol dehydrogenase
MTIAKAGVLYGFNQPLVVEELEWDEPQRNEISVRVMANGVCHTDWHCTLPGYNPTPHPIILGHEIGGIVEKVGPDCKRVKEGDHVVMSWIPSCGHCLSCVQGHTQLCDNVGGDLMSGIRSDGSFRAFNKKGQGIHQFVFTGGFSEYLVSIEDAAIVVDKDFDLHKVCLLGCRIPTGWGAVFNAAKVRPGSTALIVGLGGIGFNILQGLKMAGATVIIGADTKIGKKDWALEWGVTHFVDASKQNVIEEVTKITGIGVDYAFDGYGNATIQGQIVKSLKKGGTAVFVGVTSAGDSSGFAFSGFDFTLFQKTIIGTCYGSSNPAFVVQQLLNLYRAGRIKIDELITKEYTLDQVNESFADMLTGKNISGVVRMN